MDRVLRGLAGFLVLLLGVPPILEVLAIEQSNQRLGAGTIVVLAVVAGLYAAVRRRPLAARFTTIAYGVFGLGFALFVSVRPVPFLLAYVVGLLGMNVLLYHVSAYGPVLAAFREEDAIARRARMVALRSLGVSGLALAVAYGGSLALLPLFAVEAGSTDPLAALGLAAALVLVLMMLAVLPESPFVRTKDEWRLR
jgi:hypothetical protein